MPAWPASEPPLVHSQENSPVAGARYTEKMAKVLVGVEGEGGGGDGGTHISNRHSRGR